MPTPTPSPRASDFEIEVGAPAARLTGEPRRRASVAMGGHLAAYLN